METPDEFSIDVDNTIFEELISVEIDSDTQTLFETEQSIDVDTSIFEKK